MTISPIGGFPLFIKNISQNFPGLWKNRTVILVSGIGILILLILRKALAGQPGDPSAQKNEDLISNLRTRLAELQTEQQKNISELT